MKSFIFYIVLVFGFLAGCGSSKEEDGAVQTAEEKAAEELVHRPSTEQMFTIFHAADDSETVNLSVWGNPGYYLQPGECVLLADYDFALLTVFLGLGAWDSLLKGQTGASQAVCSWSYAYEQDDFECKPNNYVIKNEGSWFNNKYVMEPQESQHKDLSKCVYIGDKVEKKDEDSK